MLSKKQILILKKIVHGNLETNVSMKNHTTFRIGGNASVVIFPSEISDLIEAILYLNKIKCKYYCFGLGSNLLVSDNNICDTVLIKLGRNFNHVTVDKNKIIAYSGASLNSLCMHALNAELTGLEDAFGIPGSIGGAVLMNAGAYNFETKNVVSRVVALINNKIQVFTEFNFSYRHSVFQELENVLILQVELTLKRGNKANIKSRMDEIMNLRKTTQPLDFPSAGSVFKRINGIVVSYEIDKMGLKGKSIGGALISTKHAGFIVNTGKAKCQDVKDLINLVKEKFKKEKNIELKEEIKYLGD